MKKIKKLDHIAVFMPLVDPDLVTFMVYNHNKLVDKVNEIINMLNNNETKR